MAHAGGDNATGAAAAVHTAAPVIEGDCIKVLAGLDPASIDAIVCDPPYGIDFQGERWDGKAIRDAAARSGERVSPPAAYQAFTRAWATECRRVLKPGAHLLCFGSPRTAHRLACGLEEAGLALRDTLLWLYGTGMPKSRRLSSGRGTTLKPAYEPILLARTPPDGTVSECVGRHGTGALRIDACRTPSWGWPANVIAAHTADCTETACAPGCAVAHVDQRAAGRSPSRILYCPKASRTERDAGCDQLPARALDLFPNAQDAYHAPPTRNPHPTVKPLTLMRWLIRLAVPPGGLVLDPFCGSGSTGAAAALEQRRFLGIEREPAYAQIARARIAHWTPDGPAPCPPDGDETLRADDGHPFAVTARRR